MSLADTADLWWKNAVFYCLDVETFCDSDGDGIGDFGGLTSKIDHLAGLGVTCIWLMPFFPTPNHDDGYDVADHYAIDPRLGSFGDFTEFMHTARDRGMRVIADLVVNHTSDQHYWFQGARLARDSEYRAYYVWRDEVPDGEPPEEVFPGEQHGVWSYDREAGQYFLHRFYAHQPDLNIANEAVREEVRKVMGFWIAQGLSGFRVDAVPFFLDLHGVTEEMELEPHAYLRSLRSFMSRRYGSGVLLGEVNIPLEETLQYFGDEDGDELHMLFNFVVMQATWLSFARGDAGPLRRALRQLPAIPREAAWAMFLRNHDELTLDKLPPRERREVFEAFGPEPDMQVYDRGLRRRLPPMFDGDQRRIRLAYSLLFSLPGAPTLFYGEEIGMGDNLELKGRLSVRTPMQWTGGPSAGFSSAPPDGLIRPLPTDKRFEPRAVNVRDQQLDPDSLLNWFGRLIRVRRGSPEIGWGTTKVVRTAPQVLALCHEWQGHVTYTVHNVSDEPIEVEFKVGRDVDALRDAFGTGSIDVADGAAKCKLGPYGYRWLRPAVT